MKRFMILAVLAIAAPAAAQMGDMATKAPACTAPVIVPGFEAWGKGAGAAQLKIGIYSDLVLAPVEAVHYTPPLNRAPQPGQKGGLYELTFSKPGTYRFALSAGAWIDVVGRGDVQTSIAHMHGPACSGITKIVDYTLQPGEYMIEISATSVPRLQMLVTGPN